MSYHVHRQLRAALLYPGKKCLVLHVRDRMLAWLAQPTKHLTRATRVKQHAVFVQ
jgi:hypothetical protein